MLSPDAILQGRYRIVRQLGQGGMGAVYEAVDERLDTIVALKETLFADEKLRKQFEREARLLARLHHPALPRVSDHFNEGDGQFLVMQYIAGEDLFEMLARRNGPFSQVEVLTWADQLCDALDYLHTQEPQIIHRDIKPQNLKLTSRGQIVLLDFGLAKGWAGQMSAVTSSASIFGFTPNYAPLEQVQGLGTDARSDIYALSATLFHLITNVKPPDALSRAGAIVNGQSDPLPPANEVAAQVSKPVAEALRKGMSQKRDDRYPSAKAMRETLRAAAEHLPGEAEMVLPAPAALAGVNTMASERRTRLAGEQTKAIGNEAQTLLATGSSNVRGRTATRETTVVRPAPAAREWRGVLGAALLLILVAVGAGGFFAYRARHIKAQQTPETPSANSTQTAQADATAVRPDENSGQPAEARSNDSRGEKTRSEIPSPRVSTTKQSAEPKQSAEKSSESSEPVQPAPADRPPVAHEPDRTLDRTRIPNTAPPPDFPPNDRSRNPAGRSHQPGVGERPAVKTFPNGMRVVTEPDGTRIVTMPNGTTRVIPPGEKPFRRRNRIP